MKEHTTTILKESEREREGEKERKIKKGGIMACAIFRRLCARVRDGFFTRTKIMLLLLLGLASHSLTA